MSYSKVVAIISVTDYALLSDALQKHNVPGVTVSMVKGFGDYVNEFDPHGFSDNMKIEVYTDSRQAEQLAADLAVLANELTDGGGVVAIEPLSILLNVKKLST